MSVQVVHPIHAAEEAAAQSLQANAHATMGTRALTVLDVRTDIMSAAAAAAAAAAC